MPTQASGAGSVLSRSGSRDASIGHSDSATKDEVATAIASTKPNSVNNRPAILGRKAIGRKTEIRVTVVAKTAKKTCRVPTTAAASGCSPNPRCRCTFSMTTMASMTTMVAPSMRWPHSFCSLTG